jgi:metal-responsive CopG/Arc/MetJ family transcriptional regulator
MKQEIVITCRLSRNLKNKVDLIVDKQQVSISKFVKDLIKDYLNNNKKEITSKLKSLIDTAIKTKDLRQKQENLEYSKFIIENMFK